MPNICFSLSDKEYEKFNEEREKVGFPSMSSYAKYLTGLSCNISSKKYNVMTLVQMLPNKIREIDAEEFIVSALFVDEWPALSNSEKRTIAMSLWNLSKQKNSGVVCVGKYRNINLYSKNTAALKKDVKSE